MKDAVLLDVRRAIVVPTKKGGPEWAALLALATCRLRLLRRRRGARRCESRRLPERIAGVVGRDLRHPRGAGHPLPVLRVVLRRRRKARLVHGSGAGELAVVV